MEIEIELKLQLSPEGASLLESSPLFAGKDIQPFCQNALYFDTPDHALEKAGFSLRIRSSGERKVQTIKRSTSSATGLFARQEWEQEVADDVPILDATTPLAALPGMTPGRIAPVFTVRNLRTVRLWTAGEDVIEIALDRGRVCAGERENPFYEVELEQKAGDPERLFALAREIDAIAPVRLATHSKSARGYRLLGAAPVAARAETPALFPAMTVAEAFRDIALSCVRQFRLNEDIFLAHRNEEALHQARVALRRLRTACSLFRRELEGKDRLEELRLGLRWLSSELGEVRDLDVLIGRLEPGAPLAVPLLEARDHARKRAVTALDSPQARLLLLDIVEWAKLAARDEGEETLRDFAAATLSRLRRKTGPKRLDLAESDDETRHELRKAAKKLRYAIEFFSALYTDEKERKRLKHFLSALENLQDELGLLNDFVTAPLMLARLGIGGSAAVLATYPDKEKLLAKAAKAHEAFAEAKPFW